MGDDCRMKNMHEQDDEVVFRLLYLTVWDFQNAETDGICKKILTQIGAFRKAGLHVDFGYTKAGNVYLASDGNERCLGKVPVALNVMLAPGVFASKLKSKKYDAAYVRHCVVSPLYLQMLSILKKTCRKTVVEIPSYPYDAELKSSIRLRMAGYQDRLLNGRMKKYVDKIVTYSDDTMIFGISTIRTMNGVDFNNIRKINPDDTYADKVNIIAVANLAPWHGFDRLLEGMGRYYRNKGKKDILFHLVGDGKELENYREITKKWEIQDHVIFYGRKSGKELDRIYDYCTLSAACFGFHRIGITLSSNLKSREYMAKGLPILTSVEIDVFQGTDTPYVMRVPDDESPIDMEAVLNYNDSIYEGKTRLDVVDDIRDFGKKLCDISVVMQPIIEFLKG